MTRYGNKVTQSVKIDIRKKVPWQWLLAVTTYFLM